MKKKTIATAALTCLALPMFSVSANAQTTTTTTSPKATTTQTTTAPTTTGPSKRVIEPTNMSFQRVNRSTELAVAPATSPSTAWDVITSDSSLSEFAALIKSAGLESLFQRADANATYLVPNNNAFVVLDQTQLNRLKDPKFKDQAIAVVRQHVLVGRVTFEDLTRRLPNGLPSTRPSATTTTTTVQRAVESVTSDSGKTMTVRGSVVVDPSGGANHFRVTIGTGGMIEAADYPAKNGIIHVVDTLQFPTSNGSLTDLVGRR
jgi:uncharacterized surface protein with fasciclin (FAS1) repeats